MVSVVVDLCLEEPAVEEPAVEEPAVEEPAVEEPVVEEPVVEEPVVEEPTVEEPVVPVIEVTDAGTVITTETAIVTVTIDENGAIATLTAVVNDVAVADDVVAPFIGMTVPVDAAAITLDDAGVLQAIIDALNALATPEVVAA